MEDETSNGHYFLIFPQFALGNCVIVPFLAIESSIYANKIINQPSLVSVDLLQLVFKKHMFRLTRG